MATTTRAEDFIDSLAVNTHMDFANYGYENLSVVEASINYLGVTNLRHSAETASDAQTWLQVSQAAGAKFDDYIAETSVSGMSQHLSYVTKLAQEGVLNHVEGGNEEDDPCPQSFGHMLGVTAQFQQQVYALGHSLGLPVINMSFGAGWTADNGWQGDDGSAGDLSKYADYGNAHTYPGVTQCTDWSMQRLNGLAEMAASTRPVITTEFGAGLNTGFTPSQVTTAVLQATMDGMKDCNVRTYFYGLFNDGAGAFGLMIQNGTPTLAGTALHNLTTLLSDTGSSVTTFSTGRLSYSLSGESTNDNTIVISKLNRTSIEQHNRKRDNYDRDDLLR